MFTNQAAVVAKEIHVETPGFLVTTVYGIREGVEIYLLEYPLQFNCAVFIAPKCILSLTVVFIVRYGMR